MQYSTWQSVGKGLKLHGGFWGPGGTCFPQVLKPSKCSISTWQGRGKGKGRWQSAGKGLKLHGRVWGPGGTCFAQVLKPSKSSISTWQSSGKRRKVHRRVSCPSETCLVQVCLNAIFDLAKRWQRAKAARRVLGPWWNVLRAGFETL